MTQNILLKGRLNGTKRRKLAQLLDMHYTPAEIADHIGFGKRQFYRVYIPAGCPHQRDKRGRLWINGAEFRQWYFERYPKIILADNEFYCLACKKIIPIENRETKQSGNYFYWAFICPKCGHHMAKAISKKRGSRDQSPK